MATISVLNTSAAISAKTLAILETANVFTAAQTIQGSSSPSLSFTCSPATNGSGQIRLATSNTNYNWQISNNLIVAGALEFVPSTAPGGATFTTPMLSLSSTGGTLAGLLSVTGLGTHAISAGSNAAQVFNVENTTSGTLAYARAQVIANTNTTLITTFSPLWTAPNESQPQSGATLQVTGSGGLAIATAGIIKFFPNGVTSYTAAITSTGGLTLGRSTSGAKTLFVGTAPADNSVATISLAGSNTATNWQIGTNGTTASALEFTPSTAGGGETYTTPTTTITASLLKQKTEIQVTDGTITTTIQPTFIGTSTNHPVKWVINGGVKWGINTSGDVTFGSSSHVADSSGTPSIGSFTGGTSPTISGTDYAHTVSTNSNTSITVNFGHTFSSTPVIVAQTSDGAKPIAVTGPGTTGYTLTPSGTIPATIYVLVRGV